MNAMSAKAPTLDEWIRIQTGKKRSTPGLAGITGDLRLDVAGKTAATLHIDDGFVEIVRNEGHADAVADYADDKTLIDLLSGELNLVVAVLQGRMEVNGNLSFATRCLLGLQVGKPFDQVTSEQGT